MFVFNSALSFFARLHCIERLLTIKVILWVSHSFFHKSSPKSTKSMQIKNFFLSKMKTKNEFLFFFVCCWNCGACFDLCIHNVLYLIKVLFLCPFFFAELLYFEHILFCYNFLFCFNAINCICVRWAQWFSYIFFSFKFDWNTCAFIKNWIIKRDMIADRCFLMPMNMQRNIYIYNMQI